MLVILGSHSFLSAEATQAHPAYLHMLATGPNACYLYLQIEDYVQEIGPSPTPIILLGGPGSGKSSIMARVADVAVKRALNNDIPGYV